MSQLLYSRLMPFGVFLAQRHTQCILGLFLKLLLIISLSSGSCNWTDAGKVPGFSGRYSRRNSLTTFLERVFNYILLYYPTTITPVKQGLTVWQENFVLTWEWFYYLSDKTQRLNFYTDLSKCQMPQHTHTERHINKFIFCSAHTISMCVCILSKSDILPSWSASTSTYRAWCLKSNSVDSPKGIQIPFCSPPQMISGNFWKYTKKPLTSYIV